MSEFCLYPPERVAALNRRERRGWLTVGLSAAAGLLLCGIGLLLRREWLCAGGLVAGTWAAYYEADSMLRPAREAAAFARRMAAGEGRGFDGIWRLLDTAPIYVEGVRAQAVYCERDGARRTFYVRYGDALPPVMPGTAVHIESVDRFILRISAAE